jgi:hypothetical protein
MRFSFRGGLREEVGIGEHWLCFDLIPRTETRKLRKSV